MISASGLGSNHRYDSQRAGIHDKNFIADQDILIVAILLQLTTNWIISYARSSAARFLRKSNRTDWWCNTEQL